LYKDAGQRILDELGNRKGSIRRYSDGPNLGQSMTYTVAIISPGAMGSAIGARLNSHGITVLTSLEGRSPASQERAEAAGMRPASDEVIAAEAKLILSIVPPAEAINLAERLAIPLGRTKHRPTFIDCNAVSVSTVTKIGHAIEAAGVRFVDGGIIGGPPKGDDSGPTLYVSGDLSGDVVDELVQLEGCGLHVGRLDGPIGSASALKLSYAGITKGLVALGTAMILAAERAGTGQALKEELTASQPQLLARFSKALPDMYPKAYRWVDEMRSIADFIGERFPEADIFNCVADLYARIAEDVAGKNEERAQIDAFFGR
jgi:L-threonate 2-dehydrogenase